MATNKVQKISPNNSIAAMSPKMDDRKNKRKVRSIIGTIP